MQESRGRSDVIHQDNAQATIKAPGKQLSIVFGAGYWLIIVYTIRFTNPRDRGAARRRKRSRESRREALASARADGVVQGDPSHANASAAHAAHLSPRGVHACFIKRARHTKPCSSIRASVNLSSSNITCQPVCVREPLETKPAGQQNLSATVEL